ncbi:TetR/AcrR family transcriptional regulator [Acinetobacter haemolyticus]|uniref:TetR/AcrR family transcriptional regulator n=1 Tax=Acinetobacter haemolyticus TaxID=29430 RepID=UPI003F56ED49
MGQVKKQPEITRQRIIKQAIILASQKGISGVSIQHVVQGVGISKGGVFHHFANKQCLLEAMIKEIITSIDHTAEALINTDDTQHGKFTRAYIQSTFMTESSSHVLPWSALAMTLITDKTFNSFWQKWINEKLIQYKTTDAHPELNLIRLACDGLWLQSNIGLIEPDACLTLKNDLMARTYTASK